MEKEEIKKRTVSADTVLEYHPSKKSKLEDAILQLSGRDSASMSKPDIKMIKKCSILDKVKTFLPEFKRSTAQLEKQALELGKDEIDIENVSNCDRVIELDLSLVPDWGNSNGIAASLHGLLNREDDSNDSDNNQRSSSESDNEGSESETPKKTLIEEM